MCRALPLEQARATRTQAPQSLHGCPEAGEGGGGAQKHAWAEHVQTEGRRACRTDWTMGLGGGEMSTEEERQKWRKYIYTASKQRSGLLLEITRDTRLAG